MAKTRCKVKCVITGQSAYGANGDILHTAEFIAVYGTSPENAEFFKYTPSLSVKTGTIQQPFEVGKEYYLDFIPVITD